MRWLLIKVIAVTALLSLTSSEVYKGYKVYDIKVKTQKDLTFLKNLDVIEGDDRELDFLSFHNNVNDVVRLLVKPDEQQFIEHLLKTRKLEYTVKVENIQE